MSFSSEAAFSSSTGDEILRPPDDLGRFRLADRLFQSLGDIAETLEGHDDDVVVSPELSTFIGAGHDRRFHDRVGAARLGLVDDLSDMIEHEGDGARFAERATGPREIGADRARRTVAVVGQRLDDDGDAAGAIALVAHLVIVLAVIAERLLDGAVDIVLRHVLGAGVLDRETQARIHLGIGKAELRGDGDLAGELLANSFERLASAAPLRCMMFLNCEWPAIVAVPGL